MNKTGYVLIVLCFGSMILKAGGPWPAKEGKGFFKLSEWWINYDQYYSSSAEILSNSSRGIYNTSVYGEYGITDRMTAICNGVVFSRAHINSIRSEITNEIVQEKQTLSSVGDIDLGLKYGLTASGADMPISLSLILGLATGKSNEFLRTGDGEFNQMLQLDLGKSLNVLNMSAYISGYVAFNNRSNGFSEELRSGLEFGVGFLGEDLWMNTRIGVLESFKNGSSVEDTEIPSIFSNNTEFASLAFEINYYISGAIGLSAGYATAIRAENIAAAPAVNVGLFYHLK